jgi:uncharacterized protein YgfB (UPF0149 family)
MMLQVTFAEIERVIEGLSTTVVAAEAHGCLCGALCTSADYTFERWLEEFAPDESRPLPAPAEQPLRLLFNDSVRTLRGDEMTFELLLPDDDVPLERRTTALSEWCEGFLYGFSTGGAVAVKAEELPADVSEVLRDLTHISRASADVGEAGEEEEASYVEVVEYVRVGVQLIHDELQSLGDGAGRNTRQGNGQVNGEGDDQVNDYDDGHDDGSPDQPE